MLKNLQLKTRNIAWVWTLCSGEKEAIRQASWQRNQTCTQTERQAKKLARHTKASRQTGRKTGDMRMGWTEQAARHTDSERNCDKAVL